MSTNFTITVQQLMDTVLRKLRVNIQGGTASATEVTEGLQALNVMLKRFRTLGMPFWKEYKFQISLTGGVNQYYVDPLVTTEHSWHSFQCFRHNLTSNLDIPVRIVSREEYNALTNKTNTGAVVQIAMSSDRTQILTYLTPDSTIAAQERLDLYGYKEEETLTSGSDVLQAPQWWYEAIIYSLAVRLAPEYGAAAEDTRDLKQMAREALEDAVNYTPDETSVFFGPAKHGYQ